MVFNLSILFVISSKVKLKFFSFLIFCSIFINKFTRSIDSRFDLLLIRCVESSLINLFFFVCMWVGGCGGARLRVPRDLAHARLCVLLYLPPLTPSLSPPIPSHSLPLPLILFELAFTLDNIYILLILL